MSDQPDARASDPTDDAGEAVPIEPGGGPETASAPDATPPIDLERIAADLDGVDAALRRLDDGTYWNDEVTGAEIPDQVLAADPVARRAGDG